SGTGTLTFRYTVQAGDLDANGIQFSSTTIDLNGGTVKDAATNKDRQSVDYVTPTLTSVRVDAVAPAITAATGPANGTYIAGQNLDFTVTWDENVTVTGTPRIGLTIGATAQQANYFSGSGTGVLTFRYTVQAGDLDANGIQFSSTTIDLNGGTIKDAATNNAALNFNAFAPNLTSVLVDAVAPAITAATGPANATYGVGQNLNFTVTWDENVTVTGTPRIGLTIGVTPQQANYVSGSGTGTLTFR